MGLEHSKAILKNESDLLPRIISAHELEMDLGVMNTSNPSNLAKALKALKKCLWGTLYFSIIRVTDTSPKVRDISTVEALYST